MVITTFSIKLRDGTKGLEKSFLKENARAIGFKKAKKKGVIGDVVWWLWRIGVFYERVMELVVAGTGR